MSKKRLHTPHCVLPTPHCVLRTLYPHSADCPAGFATAWNECKLRNVLKIFYNTGKLRLKLIFGLALKMDEIVFKTISR
jgi:hypothetical protein